MAIVIGQDILLNASTVQLFLLLFLEHIKNNFIYPKNTHVSKCRGAKWFFGLTIHFKAKGQTLSLVGIYCKKKNKYFSPGQLYVALSKEENSIGLSIMTKGILENRCPVENVIYTDILYFYYNFYYKWDEYSV